MNISDMDRKYKPRIGSPDQQFHAQASDLPDNLGTMVTSRSGHRNPSYDYVGTSLSRPIVTGDDVQDNSMRFESNRLATFGLWPESSPIRPDRLAAAGLFYFNKEDSVRCAFCNGVLKSWVPGDDPFEEHKKFYPRCVFVIGLDVGNVPLPNDTTPSSSFPIAYRQDVLSASSRPMRPEFESCGKRLQSFANHPLPIGQTAEELAENGFFYLGPEDAVMCFWCAGSLKHWKSTDRPLSEHLRWFPQCGLLPKLQRLTMQSSSHNTSSASPSLPPRRVSQEQNVNRSTQPAMPSEVKSGPLSSSKQSGVPRESGAGMSTTTPPSSTVRPEKELEKVQEENRRLKDTLECKICMTRSVNTLFLPCGHLVCCEDCAAGSHICPMCRSEIRGTIRTYL